MKEMTENEKIMHIIENVLGAKSEKTAVSMEQIIDKGIELGFAEDYPRGKEDGHPWFPHMSVMMGVGSAEAVANNEEPFVHRTKMQKTTGGTRMFYWVDRSKKHEIVGRNGKASGVKEIKVIQETKRTFTTDEQEAKMKANPGMYRLVNGKLISEAWITANPEKFQKMYGESL